MKKVILLTLASPFFLLSCGGGDEEDSKGESNDKDVKRAQQIADATCACFEETDKEDNSAMSACWKDWMALTKEDGYDYKKLKAQIRQVNDCSSK